MGTELACLGEILKNKKIYTYIILFIAVRSVMARQPSSNVLCEHGIKSAQQRELARVAAWAGSSPYKHPIRRFES